MTTLFILLPWLLTVVALFVIMFIVRKEEEIPQEGGFSFMDDDMPFMDDDDMPFNMEEDQETIRVAIYEEKAYWVYRNVFYEAEITKEPDWPTAKPIDTMALSDKQLAHLIKVLDDLKEDEEAE